MKKMFAFFLCAIMVLACLPATAFAATIITRVELVIDLPVAERTPPNNCTILGNGYTIHSIDWEEIAGRGFLESGENFKEGYTYEATVWVKAADGYEFSNADKDTPAITGYINGDKVQVTKAYEYNAWAMVCLVVRFNNIPAKGWIKNVNLSVPAPAAGEKPSYTQLTGVGYGTANVSFSGSSNDKMQNGIAWYLAEGGSLKPGQDTFGENTSYTFHCLIFPQEGYKISNKAAVWVNGKEAEAKLDYDTFLSVNYTFPATGKIPPTHTHSYTDWAWNSGQHYKNCTGCDGVFFAEAHKGGKASCTEKAKCEVCGFAYGQEAPGHKWSPTYLYQAAAGHAWVCADCKANSTIEKHTPGPEATETTAQTCTVCGFILAPAKNHIHDLSRVPQTPAECLKGGNIEYYFCTGCNDCFTDSAGKNKIPETMSVEVAPLGHDLQAGKCSRCGYESAEEALATEPEETIAATVDQTVPAATEENAPPQSQKPAPMDPMLLIGGAAILFALALVITVILRKKKN